MSRFRKNSKTNLTPKVSRERNDQRRLSQSALFVENLETRVVVNADLAANLLASGGMLGGNQGNLLATSAPSVSAQYFASCHTGRQQRLGQQRHGQRQRHGILFRQLVEWIGVADSIGGGVTITLGNGNDQIWIGGSAVSNNAMSNNGMSNNAMSNNAMSSNGMSNNSSSSGSVGAGGTSGSSSGSSSGGSSSGEMSVGGSVSITLGNGNDTITLGSAWSARRFRRFLVVRQRKRYIKR